MTESLPIRPHMLLDAFYWRRGFQAAADMISPKKHIESLLDGAVERVPWPAMGAPLSLPKRILCVTSKYDYASKARGLSYEELNFVDTFAAMGHQVFRFDFPSVARRHGRKAMNALLLEAAYRIQPDLIFFVLFHDEISKETLQTLKETGYNTLNWFTDDHWRFDSFSKVWAPRFSHVVTTAQALVPRYKDAGVTHVHLSQWGFNPRLYRKLPIPKALDVTFIGQPYGKRKKILRAIRSAGIKAEAWGFGWPNGRVSQREMVTILNRSKISLNFSESSVPGTAQVKGRHFEIPACGTLMVTEDAPNLDQFFVPEKEMVLFDGVDDLTTKLRALLRDDARRNAIAAAGYRRSKQAHDYSQRFDGLLAEIGLGTPVSQSRSSFAGTNSSSFNEAPEPNQKTQRQRRN